MPWFAFFVRIEYKKNAQNIIDDCRYGKGKGVGCDNRPSEQLLKQNQQHVFNEET